MKKSWLIIMLFAFIIGLCAIIISMAHQGINLQHKYSILKAQITKRLIFSIRKIQEFASFILVLLDAQMFVQRLLPCYPQH